MDIRYEKDGDVGRIIFNSQDASVNILKADVLIELKRILEDIKGESLRAVFLCSEKKGVFIAGADISEIEALSDQAVGSRKASEGQAVFDLIEDLPFPSVSLINGVCLGGGLEMALACTFRVAAQNGKVIIGLPEVKLGIFPGFGGTYRLPRLLGLTQGLKLISQGKILDEKKAYRVGMVDALCSEELLFETGLSIVDQKTKILNRPKIGIIQQLIERTPVGQVLLRRIFKKEIMKLTRGNYPAVLKAVDVVVSNYSKSRQRALAHEANEFGELIAKAPHKNLIHLFYLTEKYKKEAWVDSKSKGQFHKMAVLGAGIMGGGIAQLLTSKKMPVRLKDISFESIRTGLIAASKVYKGSVKRRKINASAANSLLGLIQPTLNYSGFENVDMVVEAVVEDVNIKKKVISELESVVKESAIIASNTSALPISDIADGARYPQRIVGMHFFNPVHRMPLVEVIRGRETSDEVIADTVALSRKLGKTPVVVADSPGFLVNRILMPFLNEAGYMLEEGYGIEEIDNALLDFGLPMGAFILLDEIGIDVAYKVAIYLEQSFGQRMKVCNLLKTMYEKKMFGKKTRNGFYIDKGKSRIINPEIKNIFHAQTGTSKPEWTVVDRCIGTMINEAALCLEEKVARNASDVDISMVLGTGFAPFRGGLLKYADNVGVKNIASTLKLLSETIDKDRFKTAELISTLTSNNKTFYTL